MELSFYSVDNICSQVDLTSDTPTVDISDITFSLPFGIVYLGQFIRNHSSQGTKLWVALPKNVVAKKYLSKQRFWERFNIDISQINASELRTFNNNTSLNDIIDIEKRERIAEDIAAEIINVLDRTSANLDYGVVAEVVSELVDNFAQHSGYNLATLAMQYYPGKEQVVIAIGDCGVGIRTSLSNNPTFNYLKAEPHYVAAAKAFEPLVSGKQEGGMGLYVTS